MEKQEPSPTFTRANPELTRIMREALSSLCSSGELGEVFAFTPAITQYVRSKSGRRRLKIIKEATPLVPQSEEGAHDDQDHNIVADVDCVEF